MTLDPEIQSAARDFMALSTKLSQLEQEGVGWERGQVHLLNLLKTFKTPMETMVIAASMFNTATDFGAELCGQDPVGFRAAMFLEMELEAGRQE